MGPGHACARVHPASAGTSVPVPVVLLSILRQESHKARISYAEDLPVQSC
jgi:hypothetical protein